MKCQSTFTSCTTANLRGNINYTQVPVVWQWPLESIFIRMQSTHWAAVTTNTRQLRPTHDSYDHTKAAVTTNWCFRKMTVTTNSSDSKHADCGQTEQRHLNYCSGSWRLPTSLYQDVIVPVGIAASWWYPRLFGLAVFGRRHLGWWELRLVVTVTHPWVGYHVKAQCGLAA